MTTQERIRLEKLVDHLQKFKSNLDGDWMLKNCSYEEEMCNALNINLMPSRYYDAEWNGLFLEIKKGRSIWLDTIRYSEILLKINDAALKDTITLFFIPSLKNKRIVEEIIIVKTKVLIEKLGLTNKDAKYFLGRKVLRQKNYQESLTVNDVKFISEYIIQSKDKAIESICKEKSDAKIDIDTAEGLSSKDFDDLIV